MEDTSPHRKHCPTAKEGRTGPTGGPGPSDGCSFLLVSAPIKAEREGQRNGWNSSEDH